MTRIINITRSRDESSISLCPTPCFPAMLHNLSLIFKTKYRSQLHSFLVAQKKSDGTTWHRLFANSKPEGRRDTHSCTTALTNHQLHSSPLQHQAEQTFNSSKIPSIFSAGQIIKLLKKTTTFFLLKDVNFTLLSFHFSLTKQTDLTTSETYLREKRHKIHACSEITFLREKNRGSNEKMTKVKYKKEHKCACLVSTGLKKKCPDPTGAV